VFHTQCIRRWFGIKSPSCPVCRFVLHDAASQLRNVRLFFSDTSPPPPHTDCSPPLVDIEPGAPVPDVLNALSETFLKQRHGLLHLRQQKEDLEARVAELEAALAAAARSSSAPAPLGATSASLVFRWASVLAQSSLPILKEFRAESPVVSACFRPAIPGDVHLLATGSVSGLVTITRVSSHGVHRVTALAPATGPVLDLDWTVVGDTSLIAAGSQSGAALLLRQTAAGSLESCGVFETPARIAVGTRTACAAQVGAVSFAKVHPASLCAFADDAGYLHVADCSTRHSLCVAAPHPGSPVVSIDWSPVSPFLLASAGLDAAIAVTDLRVPSRSASSGFTRRLNAAHAGDVLSVKFMAGGQTVVSLGTHDVKLWDIRGTASRPIARRTAAGQASTPAASGAASPAIGADVPTSRRPSGVHAGHRRLAVVPPDFTNARTPLSEGSAASAGHVLIGSGDGGVSYVELRADGSSSSTPVIPLAASGEAVSALAFSGSELLAARGRNLSILFPA
jgi:WD40 repeat protein